jgi:heat shock protein HslJ
MAVVLVGVLALLVVGCGSDDDVTADGSTTVPPSDGDNVGPGGDALDADALVGRAFRSQSVTGYELAEGGETIVMTFEDDLLGVSAGCNSMSSSFAIDGSTLAWVGDPVSTMMGCPDELAAQDAWLSELLVGGVEAELDGNRLVLAADDVVIELLDEEEAVPDRPIAGTTWTLESIVEGEAASSVPADVEPPTLEVGDDGAATVFTGCNRGGTEVVVADDGASATFGPLALTRMACPGAAAEVEATVLAVLDGDVEVAVDGDQLTVAKGDAALVYRAG